MKITTIRGDMCNVHIIISNIVVIVDAGASISEISKVVNKDSVKVIFLTHSHYDHFAYINEYLKEFQNAKVYMSQQAYDKLDNIESTVANIFGVRELKKIDKSRVKEIKENESIANLEDKNYFVRLQGHTDCSMGLVVEDNLFCGDAIFENGFGRYDLPTGSFEETTHTLNKIRNLHNIRMCYAGHGKNFYIKEWDQN